MQNIPSPEGRLPRSRALSPLKKRSANTLSLPRGSSAETGFRGYRSARQLREAVSAVVQANRSVKHG